MSNSEEDFQAVTEFYARQIIIPIIAEEAIGRFLEEAEFAEWEDFGDIGEYDWEKVLASIKRRAKEIRPAPEEFEAAYKWLAERADKEVI